MRPSAEAGSSDLTRHVLSCPSRSGSASRRIRRWGKPSVFHLTEALLPLNHQPQLLWLQESSCLGPRAETLPARRTMEKKTVTKKKYLYV